MKKKSLLGSLTVIGICLSSVQALAAPWTVCGNITQITPVLVSLLAGGNGGEIPGYSSKKYEYAVVYNTSEPLPVVVTAWNQGIRITNKEPYLVLSDNPATGMKQGGFVFYKGTLASDDASCASGTIRHRYWWINTDNTVATGYSNGCFGNTIPVYCRLR
jgi:hypothetical protein